MVVQHHRVLYVVVGLVLGGPCRLGVVCDLPAPRGHWNDIKHPQTHQIQNTPLLVGQKIPDAGAKPLLVSTITGWCCAPQ